MSSAIAPRPEQTLDQLAVTANREHGLVLQAGGSMVEHAIRAGDALRVIEEHIEGGQWERWLADNFEDSAATARLYMRLSRHQDELRAQNINGITEARQHLVQIGAPPVRKGARPYLPQWMRDEAVEMRQSGVAVNRIARELGVSNPTVLRWTDPKQDRKIKASTQAARRKKRAAVRALAEQERMRAVRAAVRKAGAATAEAWTMAERMQDVLAQAQRETTDREAREALSRAGVHYRKMRDEIVRALGVT